MTGSEKFAERISSLLGGGRLLVENFGPESQGPGFLEALGETGAELQALFHHLGLGGCENEARLLLLDLRELYESFEVLKEEDLETLRARFDFLERTFQEENSSPEAGLPEDSRPTGFYRVALKPDASGAFSFDDNRVAELIGELRTLGSLRVRFKTPGLPAWADFDPALTYGEWDMELETRESEEELKDALLYLECLPGAKLSLRKEAELDLTGPFPRAVDGAEAEDPPGEEVQEAAAGLLSGNIVSETEPLPKQETPAAKGEGATLRVDARKLDRLVDLVGELIGNQARLNRLAARIDDPDLHGAVETLDLVSSELRDSSLSLRMIPVRSLFLRFNRLVRDLCRELGKKADLVLEGEETEFDKTVVEKLYDPLVHLVRNAMDHGVESPEERRAAGKPETAVLRLRALQLGSEVVIRLEDDGRGIDVNKVKARALERGLLRPDAVLSDEVLRQLILLPGFSTAEKVSDLSGRGVGMDVVKSNVESLRGTVDVSSVQGHGTSITLRFPLTLAIIDGLLVVLGGENFIVPLNIVDECLDLPGSEEGPSRRMSLRGELLPLLDLRDYLGLPDHGGETSKKVVVVRFENNEKLGLIFDAIVGQQQTVVKPLGALHEARKEYSGATLGSDGSLALILDVNRITQEFRAGMKDFAPAS